MSRIKPVEPWPEFETDSGVLSAHSFVRDDGMRFVGFDCPEDIPYGYLAGDASRLVYRAFGDETMLLGLHLHDDLRGRGLGSRAIQYFIQNSSQFEGDFRKTGLIHKPGVALALSRAGLRPESEEHVVEVLPVPKGSDSQKPLVHRVHQGESSRVVSSSEAGEFYTVVDPAEVRRRYPIGSPDRLVALHTAYLPE